jgi:NAD(P)-dependent dehydrogenase (short-subunit alcohol dehydrogenase family)
MPLNSIVGAGDAFRRQICKGLTPVSNRAPYVASKRAVVGLAKEMALELGSLGVQGQCGSPWSGRDRDDRKLLPER